MLLGRFIILTLFLSSFVIDSSGQQRNPFLPSSDKFSWQPSDTLHLTSAVSKTIEEVHYLVKVLTDSATVRHNADSTVNVLDQIWFNIMNLSSKIQLVTAVSESEAMIRYAIKEGDRLAALGNELSYSKPIYRALKTISLGDDMRLLSPNKQRLIKKEVAGFEARGIHLGEEELKDLIGIQNQLSQLGVLFESNIWNDEDTLLFTKADLLGVPEELIKQFKVEGLLIVVPVNRQNYREIAGFAVNPETRRRICIQYLSNAFPENKVVLDSLVRLRYALAQKLGYRTYAQYALSGSMAQHPDSVWRFLDDLAAQLEPMVTRNIDELRVLKRNELHRIEPIFQWDIRYYKRHRNAIKFQLDQDKIREYFELSNTIVGMFDLFEHLFSIEIKEVRNAGVWNKEVKSYELWRDGEKAGTFYLDLLSRRNKADGFFCNPVSIYFKRGNTVHLPQTALIGNFANDNTTAPILLSHEDVCLLFHEFGHLIHSLLAHPEVSSQWAFGVADDFTEAPSQFLENWCWEYESLTRFAKHYRTGKKMPRFLFNRLRASLMADLPTDYMSDLYYALVDLTLYDKVEEFETNGPEGIARKFYSLNGIPYPAGAQSVYSIKHLYNYGSNCYSYLWTRVLAQDLFSVFKSNGILNAETGLKYRKIILEQGSSVNETKMIKSFLGRDFTNHAFYKSLE